MSARSHTLQLLECAALSGEVPLGETLPEGEGPEVATQFDERDAMLEAATEALVLKDISTEVLVSQLEDTDASLLWDHRIWSAAGQGRNEHEAKTPPSWPGWRRGYVNYSGVVTGGRVKCRDPLVMALVRQRELLIAAKSGRQEELPPATEALPLATEELPPATLHLENHINEATQELKVHTRQVVQEEVPNALATFFGSGSSSETATSLEMHIQTLRLRSM